MKRPDDLRHELANPAPQSSAFTPDTIVHSMQPPGGRDLVTYENLLHFNRNDLVGKWVLDLGSGPEAKFAVGLHEAGIIPAAVITMSPDYATQRHADTARTALARAACEGLMVAGTGRNLPFRDQTFDRVVALHVSEHLRHPYERKQTIAEIARVLTHGGIGLIGPIVDIPLDLYPYQEVVEDTALMNTLAEAGVTVGQEYIPTDVLPLSRVKDHNFFTHYQPNYVLQLSKA